jgi:hypothetical protein
MRHDTSLNKQCSPNRGGRVLSAIAPVRPVAALLFKAVAPHSHRMQGARRRFGPLTSDRNLLCGVYVHPPIAGCDRSQMRVISVFRAPIYRSGKIHQKFQFGGLRNFLGSVKREILPGGAFAALCGAGWPGSCNPTCEAANCAGVSRDCPRVLAGLWCSRSFARFRLRLGLAALRPW